MPGLKLSIVCTLVITGVRSFVGDFSGESPVFSRAICAPGGSALSAPSEKEDDDARILPDLREIVRVHWPFHTFRTSRNRIK